MDVDVLVVASLKIKVLALIFMTTKYFFGSGELHGKCCWYRALPGLSIKKEIRLAKRMYNTLPYKKIGSWEESEVADICEFSYMRIMGYFRLGMG